MTIECSAIGSNGNRAGPGRRGVYGAVRRWRMRSLIASFASFTLRRRARCRTVSSRCFTLAACIAAASLRT